MGGKKTTKVMKITGETFKLKTPVKAEDVVKDYPGLVLLDSEAVKHFGIRAKPLQPQQNLEPKRLYFLVELPDAPKEGVPRRVRSGINMSAKDRLESLMLSRRSVSDLSIMKPISGSGFGVSEKSGTEGGMRLKMKLPKAEVDRLIKESKNEAEIAEKIVGLCMESRGNGRNEVDEKKDKSGSLLQQQMHWNSNNNNNNGGNTRIGEGFKARAVSFCRQ